MRAIKTNPQTSWMEILGSGFVQVPNVLLKYQAKLGLSPIELNILLDILVHWRYQDEPDKMPFPRASTIADRIGRKQRTVQRELKKLQDKQFIRRGPTRDTGRGYRVKPIDISGLIKKLARYSDREKVFREQTAMNRETEGVQNRHQ